MRFTILILMFLLNSTLVVFAQTRKFEGLIIDSITGEAISFVNIRLYNDSENFFLTSDIDGKFNFENLKYEKYNVSLKFIGYKHIDLEIDLSSVSKAVYKLTIENTKYSLFESNINKNGAINDIERETIKLFLPGGFVKSPKLPLDSLFENRYNVKLIGLGCVRLVGENYVEYNQTVFKYLDRVYGTIWREEIRHDVIGLKN